MFGGASGEEVDGIAHRGAWEELLQKGFAGRVFLERRHFHATIGEHIRKHHSGSARMGHYSAAFALDFGVHEHAANGGQLLTVLAAHNTSFAEQGIHSGIVGSQSARMRRSSTRAGSRATALDGRDVASLVDEAAAMPKQPLRVADLFHIKHDDARRLLGVEGLVQVLQHVLDAQLGTVAHCPNAVELQAVAHTVLLDEHSCCATARDEINTFGVERRDGCVEAAGIVHVEEAGAVGSDERAADRVNRINDMFLDFSAFVALLREACTDDDKAFCAFLQGQRIDRGRTILGGNGQNRAIHLRQVINLGITFNTLNLSFFWVHGINLSLEGAVHKVKQGFSARFMDVGGGSNDHDAFRVQ